MPTGNNWQNIIMKKIILFAFALMLSATTFAQQQLAVLNHNNDITVFYGANALVDAHSSAENGDIITLSSGVFNATNITKAITIRGAGAWADTTGGATMIRNNFTIDIPEDSAYHLTMEGIYTYNNLYCQQAHNPQFIKCNFQWIGVNGHSSALLKNASFVNCILVYWYSCGVYYAYYGYCSPASGTQFVNSVVMDCSNYGTNDVYINCVVKQHPENASSRMFQNCVLYYDYNNPNTPSNNSTTSFNCLYVQMNADDSTTTDELFAPLADHELWNKRGMSNVFKTFNGGTEGENFELLNNIANNYLGTDGTQIGIYGGSMPFDPKVTSPLIKRINVANRSNADGKLSVEIEVVNE